MAQIGGPSKHRFAYLDHSAETTHCQLHFDPVQGAASNDGIWNAVTGKVFLMKDALDTITRLSPAGVTASLQLEANAASLPADALAQREIAIRWSYRDLTTGKMYRFDTPGPVDAIVPTGTDDVNMASVAVLAFKAVFDANVISEDGNSVSLESGRLVGRRS